MTTVLDNGCDIVNLSYGEFSSKHDSGCIVDLMTNLVERHNVMLVSSAGNAGPALGSVCAPGGKNTEYPSQCRWIKRVPVIFVIDL